MLALIRRQVALGSRRWRLQRTLPSLPTALARCKHHLTLEDIPEDDVREVHSFVQRFQSASVPRDAVRLQFARSSGPGGQNVNKVNTKAELRFHLDTADWLPRYAKGKLREVAGQRLTKGGEIVIASDEHRTQKKNIDACFERLHRLVLQGCELPGETSAEKKQRVRQLKKAAKERRVKDKRFKSEKKRSRKGDDWR